VRSLSAASTAVQPAALTTMSGRAAATICCAPPGRGQIDLRPLDKIRQSRLANRRAPAHGRADRPADAKDAGVLTGSLSHSTCHTMNTGRLDDGSSMPQ